MIKMKTNLFDEIFIYLIGLMLICIITLFILWLLYSKDSNNCIILIGGLPYPC